MRLGGPEIIVLVLIVLLLFGTTRLPKLARAMREAKDEFEKGQSGEDETAGGEARGGSSSEPATPPEGTPAEGGEKPST